jgi:Fe-S-cluster containining protein
MDISQLLSSYELLADRADAAFKKMSQDHPECVTCDRRCSDCCHAVFGLFLVEAAYLKIRFDELHKDLIRETLWRCVESERDLKRLEAKMRRYADDHAGQAQIMAQERVRCPLLSTDQECILYPHRPITCRVYGIPTRIQGRARACWKSDFKAEEPYPVFDLDGVQRGLFELSKALLRQAGIGDLERASLLFSVPKVLTTPLECLITNGAPESPPPS